MEKLGLLFTKFVGKDTTLVLVLVVLHGVIISIPPSPTLTIMIVVTFHRGVLLRTVNLYRPRRACVLSIAVVPLY
jgi:hypothetical protein